MRHYPAEFVQTNVRPEDYNTKYYNVGDCTTRAMTYCLEGKMTYKEIEAEQYRRARIEGRVRNVTGVWDKVLTTRGYSWIQLNKVHSRGEIAFVLLW